MFAAHFAAGLAIGAHARRAPMAALLAGAFLPDIVWIGLAVAGIEPSAPAVFFDGWSHSFASVLVMAALFALCFAHAGMQAWLPAGLAVMSHVVLDAIVHPVPIALYPHASLRVPWDLWSWGAQPAALGFSHYWWIQLAVVVALLGVYARASLRSSFPPNLVAATVLLVLGLHMVI
ncbi:hypothetical protein ABQJ54_17750 [Rhodanobacter sp. Si-c]|uniref:Metal-dependent hydrolase n=1 Tax=Rhodanobacter lycopersici TaxID=3162487 RepID=A0ABV3QJY1_9GAMM